VLYGSAYQGGAQAIVFALQLPTTPLITSQPTNFATVVGNTASFSVGATGSLPLSYQWALNGTNILGATSATYVISNSFPTNSGFYSVTITNEYGSTNSAPAALTVNPVPLVSPKVLASGFFQFSFFAAPNVNYTIQYSTTLANWTPIATFSPAGGLFTITDPNATSDTHRFYRVSVSPVMP
jgi:hypothetical protein